MQQSHAHTSRPTHIPAVSCTYQQTHAQISSLRYRVHTHAKTTSPMHKPTVSYTDQQPQVHTRDSCMPSSAHLFQAGSWKRNGATHTDTPRHATEAIQPLATFISHHRVYWKEAEESQHSKDGSLSSFTKMSEREVCIAMRNVEKFNY